MKCTNANRTDSKSVGAKWSTRESETEKNETLRNLRKWKLGSKNPVYERTLI